MALFQPTNIIPSSFTEGVVDAAQDIAQVSWQVNGNSAMTAYKIDFFQNNDDSTPIPGAGTGIISDGIPSGGFYGTDRFGRPKMFTWTVNGNKTWNAYNPEFKNGGQFKFKITQYWQDGESEQSISQIEETVFTTRAKPSVLIYLSSSSFQPNDDDTPLENGSVISTSIGYFRAIYSQEQGDAARNTRWQIATATFSNNQWEIGEIISDTGEVNTSTLQFVFNGFFNERSYAVRCLIESEGGQQAQNPASQNDGWIFFEVKYVVEENPDVKFTLNCLNKENAALLSWTSNGADPSVSGNYTIQNGTVALQENSRINWISPGMFNTPWTAAIKFSIVGEETYTITRGFGFEPTTTRTYYARNYFTSSVRVRTPEGCSSEYKISGDKKSCTVTITWNGKLARTASVIFQEIPFSPNGAIANLNMENHGISIYGIPSQTSYRLYISGAGIEKYIAIPFLLTKDYVLAINAKELILYYFSNENTFEEVETVEYSQEPLKSIGIRGGETGAEFQCVSVFNGDLSNDLLKTIYAGIASKPSWGTGDYALYLNADFAESINGSRFYALRIYRQEVGDSNLFPILYSKNGSIDQCKDFGIVSRKAYTYWLYEYDKNDAYLQGIQCVLPDSESVATISTHFKNYSLLVCDYDSENDTYHVRKQYIFALNLSEGSVGNNNVPTMNANFTAFPTRMPSTQNYASGTLQGLIGAIYTVPALVEQIGGFKHMAKPSTLDYFDSVDLEKELYELSTAPYQLFLRDMKGHLRMVATNGAISMTQNLKNRHLSTTISLPWVEIGDASDVTIIQTPDDYGWNNDNQVLDVRLDVDPTTGVLMANYPKPYNGTKFYLTGAHKETLAAKTPVGIMPAQFSLSETAEKPDDGTLSATARVNTEKGD